MRLDGHIDGVLDVMMKGVDHGDHVQYTMEMVDNGGELVSAMDMTMQDENGTNMTFMSGSLQAGGQEIATVDGSMDRGTDAMSIRFQNSQDLGDDVEFSLEINTDGDLGISVHGGFKLLDEWSEEIFSVGFSGEQASDPEDIVIVSAEANLAVEARRVAELR